MGGDGRLAGKSLLKDELVSEEEWKRRRERFRLDVEAEEANGERNRTLPRGEPAKVTLTKVTKRKLQVAKVTDGEEERDRELPILTTELYDHSFMSVW